MNLFFLNELGTHVVYCSRVKSCQKVKTALTLGFQLFGCNTCGLQKVPPNQHTFHIKLHISFHRDIYHPSTIIYSVLKLTVSTTVLTTKRHYSGARKEQR